MHGERVKHTISSDEHQDRTHPVLYTLQEEWEKRVQTIQNPPARHALIKTHSRGARMIRTIEVQDRKCSEKELQTLKKYLAGRTGLSCGLARARLGGV